MSLFVDRSGDRFDLEGDPMKINMTEDSVTSLEKEYVVQLLHNSASSRLVVAEEVFDHPPTDDQILWCLLKHKEARLAVKEERYRTVIELPFK